MRLLGSRDYKNYLNEVEIKKDDPLYTNYNNTIEHFDARDDWKLCKQIGHIRDRGHCGFCWVGTAI